MYEFFPPLDEPDDSCVLWHYMDAWKYQSMLESSCLYFHRADKFTDLLEGTWPGGDVERFRRVRHQITGDPMWPLIGGLTSNQRHNAFVSCWIAAENESLRMWHEYGAGECSVVVKTNVARIKRALVDSKKVNIGRIKYVDHATGMTANDNLTHAVFTKDGDRYGHENEVRLVHFLKDWLTTPDPPSFSGMMINIASAHLIDTIYVRPNSTRKERARIRNLTALYGVDSRLVLRSRLG